MSQHAAQQLASALYNTQFDESYWDQAISILGAFVGEDRLEVAAAAMKLGADPTAMQSLLSMLGGGETIEITGTAPRSKAPTNYLVLGALALGAYLMFFAKKKR